MGTKRLSEEQRELIKKLRAEGVAVNDIAEKLGVNRKTVWRVVNDSNDNQKYYSSIGDSAKAQKEYNKIFELIKESCDKDNNTTITNKDIMSSTGWPESKVSRLITLLEHDGLIERFFKMSGGTFIRIIKVEKEE